MAEDFEAKVDDLEPGTVVGERYIVKGLVGVGGQASVYLVHDPNLEVDRALKWMHAASGRRNRLDREARLLASISHSAVLQVVDMGAFRGRRYLVTHYVEGGSLAAHIREHGPMPIETFIPKFREVLDGLAAVHAKGVIHRDVKPSNLLMGTGGFVLADFGVAKELSRNETFSGAALGTLEYMAPEQQTDASRVSPASDVYALGATMFHALTSQSPMHLFLAERDSGRLGSLPPAIRAAIWRATRIEPHRRYQSVRELADALETKSATLPPPKQMGKAKIVMLGASAVGKTSLVRRFVHSMFDGDYRTTIGVHIQRRDVDVDGVTRTCVIWDVEGEDRWAKTRLPMMRGAHGFIVVVDGTRPNTARAAHELLMNALRVSGPRPFALLLNKSDLMSSWTVSSEELKPLLRSASSVFHTSARSGKDVLTAFESLVRAIQ